MDDCRIKQVLFLFSFSSLSSICTAQTIAFRLVNGYSEYEGRVEVYFQGEWGTVSRDHFDWTDAHVVCRELGFGGVNEVLSSSYFGSGSGSVLNFMNCSGYETDISECMVDSSWLTDSYLYHHLDTGLRCNHNAGAYATEGSIRLAGGNFPSEGRVELYHHSRWGTVCDGAWDISDADVVCRQLGYPGALSAVYGGTFDQGTGDIWFDYVECSGYEDRLTDCFHGEWLRTWCSHYNDAGVRCMVPGYLTPRLANGSRSNVGRVEVWTGYQWERICHSGFNSYAEHVVCRQLGYDTVSTENDEYTWFGNGDTIPVALQFYCNDPGDETETVYLAECALTTIERFDCDGVSIICHHYEDDEETKKGRFPVYLSISGVIVVITSVVGCHYKEKIKKRRAQTEPNDTPATQATTPTENDQSLRTVEFVETTTTDERRPPHHLAPINKPPSYSDAIIAPPPYQGAGMVGRLQSYSSYPTQQTMNMQENEYAFTGNFKPEGDNTDTLATPSRDRLYEEWVSTQLPALPDIARPENLPSVT